MASGEQLDLPSLLTPIPGDKPTGVNPRDDISPESVFHALKDVRNRARRNERQVVWEDDEQPAEKPDWKPLLDRAPRLLTEQAKDLEIAAWYVEALVREHGYAGLRDGLRLLNGLIDQYWDQVYPLPDEEEGLMARLAPITGLNGDDAEGTLIRPIKQIAITQGGDFGPYSQVDYEQAAALEQITDPTERAHRLEMGAVTMEMFDKAVAQTSAEFFRNVYEDLNASREAFDQLCIKLEARCGSDEEPPPSSNIRNALEECRHTLMTIAKEALGLVEGSSDAEAGASSGPGGGGAAQGAAGHIHSRNQALQTLLKVAQFFRETEPHSPLSYGLEQLVRWGKMSLPELLSDIVSDTTARDSMFQRVGIPAPRGQDSGA